jgi:putative glycosyltransferase
MKLSIITTLYQSAPYIEEFYRRSTKVATEIAGNDYEIIFVNDGSPDNSLDIAIDLSQRDDHLCVINLSRNFGHHKAMMTGLEYSQGNLVFLIDSDLEEEPEWLLSFLTQLESEKSDVIFGVQKIRKGNWFEGWSGNLFYTIFNFMTGMNFPKNIVTAKLMRRCFVDALVLHKERELSIGGLCFITGFKQNTQTVKKHSSSQSTYTLKKKLSVFINSITSFSNLPLILIFYVGLFIFLGATSYIFYLIINWLFLSSPPSGWTSMIASIWLLGGIIIFFIGIIGLYISKIYIETKQRPYVIIQNIYRKTPH